MAKAATKRKSNVISLMPYIEAEKRPYIRCRTLGHAWHDVDSLHWKPQWGVPLTLRCERCDMERRDTVRWDTGELLNRRYVKPKSYYYGKEHPAPTRSEFRRLLLELRGVTEE